MLWLRESPSYFRFRNGTIRLEEPVHDEVTGQKLNIDTGAFEPATQADIDAVFEPGADLDFAALSEEQFVKETEEARNHYLRGEGPIFDIYRQIDEITDQARQERRPLEAQERDTLTVLRRRTFDMWEQEFGRRAAGEPPSFRYSGDFT
ncbi:hypothetical protein [Nocardia seriolae]|uniref:Uncharacterized protein n=1 Tax=Nocardia seriolae TaxID=37332 RepID=A0A0B8NDY3_9NOCA|nr:hypothetical protein [Nocardia seriolae]APB01545.1 hypothetical protein NS506_07525 [Nocardia seriolae]MTJ60976.1 hypothetical protein [Nocardia seriolae]MTJ71533.1 hypothetical protein [Nocardia seriolae]MTJ90890.1 hypothetical protein [Nocardia seriolae]MTK34847.1 hypothetical protein [Nocardia seriolae]